MLNRRTFLTAALLSSAAGKSLAQYHSSPGLQASPSGVVVLQLVNFFCSRCNLVNEQHIRFLRTARDNGLDFRVAPTAGDRQSIWPDRFFYAIRDMYPDLQDMARDTFFRGVHRDGLQFENMEQTVSYLNSEGVFAEAVSLYPNFSEADLIEYASSDNPILSGSKAVALIEKSGAEEFPIFLWIQDGEIIHSVTTFDSTEPLRLTMLVVNSMKQPLK